MENKTSITDKPQHDAKVHVMRWRLCYGISRWTNFSRARRRHIDMSKDDTVSCEPLCNVRAFTFEHDGEGGLEIMNCPDCKRIWKRMVRDGKAACA